MSLKYEPASEPLHIPASVRVVHLGRSTCHAIRGRGGTSQLGVGPSLTMSQLGCIPRSGDTPPCRMTGVTLHGIVSPEAHTLVATRCDHFRRAERAALQGYLAHKKPPPTLGPYGRPTPRVLRQSWGEALSYERRSWESLRRSWGGGCFLWARRPCSVPLTLNPEP